MSVDNSEWDGGRAMKQCSTAAEYAKICAGRKAGDPSLRSSYALPHHYLANHPAPNAAGVRAALQRFSQTEGLTNAGAARRHLEAHMAQIQAQRNRRPPRDNLLRAIPAGYEVRSEDDEAPILFGHFTPFNEWATIESKWEGRFLERIAPGSFAKTFRENRNTIKVTFNHGKDGLGNQILGSITELREEEEGPYYEVRMFEGIPPLLMSGLRAGEYGSSFRFRVTREEFDKDPERSDHNPEALPERTIREVDLYEFGPVTWPAYEGATAGVRSLTDEFNVLTLAEAITADPERVRELVQYAHMVRDDPDPTPTPVATTSARFRNREEWLEWTSRI